jgi:hypothetical protein
MEAQCVEAQCTEALCIQTLCIFKLYDFHTKAFIRTVRITVAYDYRSSDDSCPT